MARRFFALGLAFFITTFAVGCHGRIAYIRSNAACGNPCGGCCSVPFAPVVRTPILYRPYAYGPYASPAVAAPTSYGNVGYPVSSGGPSCSSCSSTMGTIASNPYSGNTIAATGPYYQGAIVPQGSTLLPNPMVVPGSPKVEATTEPKPMPK